MSELKNWIVSHLIGKTGKVIAKKTKQKWFFENGCLEYYNRIISTTSFLPVDSSLSQRVWHILNDKLMKNQCANPGCSNPTTFLSYIRGYLGTCCNRCAQKIPETLNKIKTTNLAKYGCEYGLQNVVVQKKRILTCLEKYGVNNVSKLSEISQRKKRTCRKNHGVDWILQDTDRIKNGVIKKYGVDNVQKSTGVKYQTTSTRRGAFYDSLFSTGRLNGVAYPLFTKLEYINGGYYQKYKFECTKCKAIFEDCLEDGDIPRCTECYKGSSIFEKEVTEYIKSIIGISVPIIENDKKTLSGNRELDILLPTLNLAIECNGLFWHGEIGGNKTKKYHFLKTKECENKGIHLIQLLEDEWINKQPIVKTKLSHILGKSILPKIYARKCIIKEIIDGSHAAFEEQNHIQGSETSSSVRLGAYYNGHLISLMTFGGLRASLGNKKTDRSYEIYRFCSDSSYVVIGAAGKLLSYFIKHYNPLRIISYADRRWTNITHNIYDKTGFSLLSPGTPNYWYFGRGKNYKRYHRYLFRKSELPKKLSSFDPNLTEWENMKNNGWDRIWDCGNLKYERAF